MKGKTPLSRRGFLKRAALTGAAVAIPAYVPGNRPGLKRRRRAQRAHRHGLNRRRIPGHGGTCGTSSGKKAVPDRGRVRCGSTPPRPGQEDRGREVRQRGLRRLPRFPRAHRPGRPGCPLPWPLPDQWARHPRHPPGPGPAWTCTARSPCPRSVRGKAAPWCDAVHRYGPGLADRLVAALGAQLPPRLRGCVRNGKIGTVKKVEVGPAHGEDHGEQAGEARAEGPGLELLARPGALARILRVRGQPLPLGLAMDPGPTRAASSRTGRGTTSTSPNWGMGFDRTGPVEGRKARASIPRTASGMRPRPTASSASTPTA